MMSFKKPSRVIIIAAAVFVVGISAGLIINMANGAAINGLVLRETPQVYLLESDDSKNSFEAMPSVTLFENGSARLSQPPISSYALIGNGEYSVRGDNLTVTHGGFKVTFSISDNGSTLKIKTTNLHFSKVDAVYKYQSKSERYSGYDTVNGEVLTEKALRDLEKNSSSLTRANFERYKHIKKDPDQLIFDVDGKYTLVYRVAYDGGQSAYYENNRTGEVSAIVLSAPASTSETRTDLVNALTVTELAYFNEEFFNGGYMNIRNQFLSSLYESPEMIDLFGLFYCGSGQTESVTDAERAAVITANGWNGEPDCACEKNSRANMDAVLTMYAGLTLADTEKIGLEHFTYLEEYGAYYYYHGDTNYRGSVTITAGEHEGDLVRLYYDDIFMADGWKCVTLREADGGYHFVSNQTSKKPAIPTVLPEGADVPEDVESPAFRESIIEALDFIFIP